MLENVVLRTSVAAYLPGALPEPDAHGLNPISDQLVVLADKVAEKAGSILLPDAKRDTQNLATQSGIIVAVGEGCFLWNSDRTRPYVGRKPQVGDRVIFPRYAGELYYGRDGQEYLFMEDKAIRGILTTPAQEASHAA